LVEIWKDEQVPPNENFPLSLKKRIFTQCVIPTLLYAAEIWATTKMLNNKIRSTQLSMERKMLGITWQDKVTNKKIREQTKLPNALRLLKSYKWKWAGHVARASENWANTVTRWTPAGKRKKGRPKTRWVKDIKARDRNWITSAQDRGRPLSSSGIRMTKDDDDGHELRMK